MDQGYEVICVDNCYTGTKANQHKLSVYVVRIFNTYGPRMHPDDGRVVSNFIVQALHQVNLEHLAYKEPHSLSYCQKKGAALAGILAMQPEVLILDEPTANLDPDLPTPVFMQDDKLCSLKRLSFSYRQRTTTIQKLQHEHEHRHPHLHIHEHPTAMAKQCTPTPMNIPMNEFCAFN